MSSRPPAEANHPTTKNSSDMPKLNQPLSTFSRAALLAAGLFSSAALALNEDDYNSTLIVGSSADSTNTSGCLGNGGSSCTLRAAILYAASLDGPVLIKINPGINPALTRTGTAENLGETGDLDISVDIGIVGLNTTTPNTVSGGLNDRVFHIISGARVEMSFLEITNGLVSSSETSIAFAGGGILVDEGAELKLENTIIRNNEAPIGGGIANLGRLEIRSNTLGSSLLELNRAINVPSNFLISDMLSQSFNPGQGGAIANFGGQLFLGAVIVQGNKAGIGGAIYNSSAGLGFGNATITNSQIQNNTSLTHGGGIANLGPMNINNSAVINNASDATEIGLSATAPLGDGGGIFNSATANIDLINVTISGNTARAGGGLFNSRNATLTNVTLYDNTAIPCSSNCDQPERAQMGGHQLAMYDTDEVLGVTDPDTTVVNTVIANNPVASSDVTRNNSTGSACAAYGLLGGTPATAFSISQTVIPDFITTLGNNLSTQIGVTSGEDTCGFDNSSDFPAVADALQLLPLGINTPPGIDPLTLGTTLTHAPDLTAATPSPLIDAGSNAYCPQTDQRFLERGVVDTCDIGAYEASGATSLFSAVVDLKVDIIDTPDPVSPNLNTADGQLTYYIDVTNLYEGPPAEVTEVLISVDPSVLIKWTSTEKGSSCIVNSNEVRCAIGQLLGLETVRITISATPTVAGTIETTATVSSATGEAFSSNNTAVETTQVTNSTTRATNNFGGSGGGGALHWLWLTALATLAGWRSRRQPLSIRR